MDHMHTKSDLGQAFWNVTTTKVKKHLHKTIILKILKAKNIKIMVFKDVTPCCLVERYQDIHSSGILNTVDWSSPTSYKGL